MSEQALCTPPLPLSASKAATRLRTSSGIRLDPFLPFCDFAEFKRIPSLFSQTTPDSQGAEEKRSGFAHVDGGSLPDFLGQASCQIQKQTWELLETVMHPAWLQRQERQRGSYRHLLWIWFPAVGW
ncbi:Hypothetical predicted protein [Marmota monax]|uniref:Uncharacterized protein n=1 Tax=Marmota monax TaxID=9995 RepID=A0A5E4AR15_MARMO|nr:Hypothetical predicted protein [Marmota monax]